MAISTASFGSTGLRVTRLGLGGEGVLRTFGRDLEAQAVIEAALEGGITYLESARAYSGSERYYGGALGKRKNVTIASKAHDRSKAGALAMLETSLRLMGREHLDLWQFHDVREWSELDEMGASGAAYEAFAEAKARGLVRFIGLTGHHDPAVLRACLERYAFDSVLLPINPAEGCLPDAFERSVIPAARARGMAVIGMKVYVRGLLFEQRAGGVGPQEALDYALSADVDTLVIGCDNPAQVRFNIAAAERATPMTAQARRNLEGRVAEAAPQLAYYRGPRSA